MVTFLGSLVQSCCGEGGTLLIYIAGMCSQSLGYTGFAPAQGVCTFPVYTAQALGCSAGNCLRWALGCMHFPGLSRSGSGSRVLHKGARVLYPSQARAAQVARCLASAVVATYPFSRPSRRVFWVYKERAFSGGSCVSSGELISG